jgi:hypothetical protein
MHLTSDLWYHGTCVDPRYHLRKTNIVFVREVWFQWRKTLAVLTGNTSRSVYKGDGTCGESLVDFPGGFARGWKECFFWFRRSLAFRCEAIRFITEHRIYWIPITCANTTHSNTLRAIRLRIVTLFTSACCTIWMGFCVRIGASHVEIALTFVRRTLHSPHAY